jgi:hypothetical protein
LFISSAANFANPANWVNRYWLLKKHANFPEAWRKERHSLPVVNYYLIVFNVYVVLLAWENRAE